MIRLFWPWSPHAVAVRATSTSIAVILPIAVFVSVEHGSLLHITRASGLLTKELTDTLVVRKRSSGVSSISDVASSCRRY